MKNKYTATFSFGTVTRESAHQYKTAAVAVKGGEQYWGAVFSSGKASARMPGDQFRASAKCRIYNSRQKAELLAKAAQADEGWVEEVVNVTSI